MDSLLLADVVVTHFVEVDEAHVVAADFADRLAFVEDLATEIILGLAANVAELEARYNLIGCVLVNHLAKDLMTHSAKHDIVHEVVIVVKLDSLPVFELDQFVTFSCDVATVHAGFHGIARPAGQLEVLVGTFNDEVRNRRVVARLLKVDVCAVLPICFIGFAENRVEWLLKELFEVKVGERATDSELHLFYGVRGFRSSVEVDRVAAGHGCHTFEH